MPDTLANVAHTIQLSVAPVFLLTAIGTFLGVLNTRLIRIIDRGRVISERMAPLQDEARAPYRQEMRVLQRRRHAVNFALGSGVFSALLVCFLIALAFIGSIVRVDFSHVVAILFIGAMMGFVSALLLFLREVMLAVSLLGIEPH
jgi:hypothetical protein